MSGEGEGEGLELEVSTLPVMYYTRFSGEGFDHTVIKTTERGREREKRRAKKRDGIYIIVVYYS